MQRTYSRKGTKRRLATQEISDDTSPTRFRKRQKIEVEVVMSAAHNASPTLTHSVLPGALHDEHSRTHGDDNGSSLGSRSTPVPSPIKLSHATSKGMTKDLSDLFDFATHAASSSSTVLPSKASGGLAKRMLGRSRTESTISSTSMSVSIGRTDGVLPSMPSTPRKIMKTLSGTILSPLSQPSSPSKSQSNDDISSPAAARSVLSTTNIRTYAGKSRSFLVPLGIPATLGSRSQSLLDDDEIVGTTPEDDFEVHESYTDLRTRWGVDNSEDDPRPPSPSSAEASPNGKNKRKGKGKQTAPEPPLPNGMLNDLKSITELRSKGESRRFLDEVGYLFEGLDPKGAIGVRRGSALEIMTKLCDAEFARRAKAADFLGRAWEVLRNAGAGNGDKVLDTLLACFAALIAEDPRDLAELASKSDFTTTLYNMLTLLTHENDPLWLISCGLSDAELRHAGLPKMEKAMLANVFRLVSKKSGLIEDGELPSNRLLISQALAALSPTSHNICHLDVMLRSLTAELHTLPSRISAYISGLDILPLPSPSSHRDIPSFSHIDNCLRLFDLFLLGRWDMSGDEAHTQKLETERESGLCESLVALGVACEIISRDPQHTAGRPIVQRCTESTFRVLINLTHNNVPWCHALLGEPLGLSYIMRTIVMSHRQRFDRISVKQEPQEDEPDIDGGGSDAAQSLDRLCLALGLLTNLVQVTHAAKDEIRELTLDPTCKGKRACTKSCQCISRVSALECLVSVYIPHCKSESELDPVVRGHIAVVFGLLMQDIPENQRILLSALPGMSDRQKLDALAENAREFVLFYVEFTKRVSAVTVDDGTDEVLEISRSARDTNGATIAKDIVVFFEKLRDQCSRPPRS